MNNNGTQAIIDKALDFLRNNIEVTLAKSENNKPHIRIFQIMKIEGTILYFSTSREKGVCRQLHENPYIEIMAYNDEEFVKCSGKADFDVADATARWIYANNPVLPRLYPSYDKLVYFKLGIEEMDHYDLKPTPPYLSITTSEAIRREMVMSRGDTANKLESRLE